MKSEPSSSAATSKASPRVGTVKLYNCSENTVDRPSRRSSCLTFFPVSRSQPPYMRYQHSYPFSMLLCMILTRTAMLDFSTLTSFLLASGTRVHFSHKRGSPSSTMSPRLIEKSDSNPTGIPCFSKISIRSSLDAWSY